MFNGSHNLNNEKGMLRTYDGSLPFFAWVLKTLKDEGYTWSICGGNYGAKCGKCKVRIASNVALPTPAERKMLKPEELREGIRLACQTTVKEGTEVEILFGKRSAILTDFELTHEDKLPERDVIGIDLGTSTIACAYYSGADKKVLKTSKAYNPQVKYGADVLSRIDAAEKEGREKISEELLDCLYNEVQKLCKELNRSEIPECFVAGNTVMLHVLAGADSTGLGKAPFKPEFLDEKVLRHKDMTFVLLPGISAFVGADITAGLAATGMMASSDDETELFIDLGTNAEIALNHKGETVCAATAAGSAFSIGDKEGSHGIHLLAELLRNKQVDDTGLITGESKSLTQQDIRDLQLAKAAVRTGIETLLTKAGVEASEVARTFIAGGFGYYLNGDDAVTIGMLPEGLKGQIKVCGNTSLLGSLMYDRIRESVKGDLLKCKALNLALMDDFNDSFIKQVNFNGFV